MAVSPFQAVIFDLDGTLLDTLDELGIITNTVLELNGFPGHPLPDYRYLVGEGAESLITKALGHVGSNPEIVRGCLEEFLEIYRETCGNRAKLYDGISNLLSDLADAGMKMAVLSNKPHDLTLKNIDLFLSAVPFEIVLGQRAGVPKKPDPQGALEISDHMGLDPARILYLGDTSIDMRTAVAAGMCPVGVLWGFRGKEELLAHGARHLIGAPAELLNLL